MSSIYILITNSWLPESRESKKFGKTQSLGRKIYLYHHKHLKQKENGEPDSSNRIFFYEYRIEFATFTINGHYIFDSVTMFIIRFIWD